MHQIDLEAGRPIWRPPLAVQALHDLAAGREAARHRRVRKRG